MQDQVEALQAMGVAAERCTRVYLLNSLERIETLTNGEVSLLYVSPERALQAAFIERLQTYQPQFIAIDEALYRQWGHDFRPEYGQLGQLRHVLPNVPFMALTATADAATQQDIIERLG